MGLASLGLEVGVFCEFLFSVLLCIATWGLDFSGRTQFLAGQPQRPATLDTVCPPFCFAGKVAQVGICLDSSSQAYKVHWRDPGQSPVPFAGRAPRRLHPERRVPGDREAADHHPPELSEEGLPGAFPLPEGPALVLSSRPAFHADPGGYNADDEHLLSPAETVTGSADITGPVFKVI
jgi:hypothetical protein